MALLLSPTVSFLVSPCAPRPRALSAAANVSYPGKLRWCASSIPVVLFEFNSPLYAVLAGWGRFLGWMSCPISCNPRMELRMRGIWSLWLCAGPAPGISAPMWCCWLVRGFLRTLIVQQQFLRQRSQYSRAVSIGSGTLEHQILLLPCFIWCQLL
jgi:hypothetical protein